MTTSARMDRAGWLAARRTGIGSSDIPGILGISPWTTPFQVWASKVAELPDESPSEDAEWGLKMETLIVNEAADRLGVTIDRYQPFFRHPDHEFIIATPDSVTTDGLIVEAKKVDAWAWDEVPEHYRIQVLWQMAASGCRRAVIAALHRGRHLKLYEVERDEELAADLLSAAAEFWHDHVLANVPPPVTADDSAFMGDLFPTSVEQTVEVGEEVAAEVAAAREAFDAAKARKDAAEAALKAAMADADTAVVGQRVVATWKTTRRNGYTVKPSEYRRLTWRGLGDE